MATAVTDRLVELLSHVPPEVRGDVLVLVSRLGRARSLLADVRRAMAVRGLTDAMQTRVDAMLEELERLV